MSHAKDALLCLLSLMLALNTDGKLWVCWLIVAGVWGLTFVFGLLVGREKRQ